MRSDNLRRCVERRDQAIRLAAAIRANKFQTGYDGPPIQAMTTEKQNARIEHDKSPARVMAALLRDDTELFRHRMDKTSFRRWTTDRAFGLNCEPAGAGGVERP
jgi:hypothetical protein